MRDCLKNCDPLVLAAAAIAAIAAATLGGAWFFQYVLDIKPCPLCLEQRYAYYLIIPLAALIAWARPRGLSARLAMLGLGVIALAALANTVLGSYHAGVEWGFWPGPTDCSGTPDFSSGGSLLSKLNNVRVIRCDEVQWRFLGLSLAGYNVLISLVMAAIAGWGVFRAVFNPPARRD
jgi:disulfide bond formation protein DsbB